MKKSLSLFAVLALFAGFANAADAGHALADRHVARGMKCTACHVDEKGGKLKAEDSDYGVCATCHGDYNAMIKKTDAKFKNSGQPNPHAQHEGALPCTECHKGHTAGVNYCAKCHSYSYKVP